MILKIRLTYGDLAKFLVWQIWRSAFAWLVGVVALGITIVPMTLRRLQNGNAAVVIFSSLTTMAIFLLGYWIFIFVVSLLQMSRKRAECTLELTEEALLIEGKNSRTELKWPGIVKCKVRERYIYLYITRSQALVIPRRVFINYEAWRECVEFCLRKTSAAA